MWEEYKYQAIKDGHWARGSKALQNPSKTFFLHLAAKAVQRVNAMRDANEIGYTRMAMIRCGLSLDDVGLWQVPQLSLNCNKSLGSIERTAPYRARIASVDYE
jgi:hypothetical protein